MADDQVARNLAGDEQTARGLGIGQEEQVVLGDPSAGHQVRAYPVEVAARAAGDEPVAQQSSRAPSSTGTAAASITALTPEARHLVQVSQKTETGHVGGGAGPGAERGGGGIPG